MIGRARLIVLAVLATVVGLIGGCSDPVPVASTPDAQTAPETIEGMDLEQQETDFYQAELIDELEMAVGQSVMLESLRETVAPPYVSLLPFIELPDGIVVEAQYALDEDGVHGVVYQLTAVAPVEGTIIIGFRDLQTDEVTHSKELIVTATET